MKAAQPSPNGPAALFWGKPLAGEPKKVLRPRRALPGMQQFEAHWRRSKGRGIQAGSVTGAVSWAARPRRCRKLRGAALLINSLDALMAGFEIGVRSLIEALKSVAHYALQHGDFVLAQFFVFLGPPLLRQ